MLEIGTQHMRVSLFQMGLLITIIGISFAALMFIDSERESRSFIMNSAQTKSLEKYLEKEDVGFFKTYLPNFKGDSIFIQIIDPQRNIIADKKIETRLAINYFDIVQDGKYILKITNLSQNPIYSEIEIGQINTKQMSYPGLVIVTGIIIIIISSYNKLKNYNIAHPDENSS